MMTANDFFDTTAHPEKALLSSVCLLAVNDACIAPLKPRKEVSSKKDRRFLESASGLRMSVDAFTGMRFLFDESSSGLNEYAAWLDFDPGQFRARLLRLMQDTSANVISGFESMRRRNFRLNYTLWQEIRKVQDYLADDIDEEDNYEGYGVQFSEDAKAIR